MCLRCGFRGCARGDGLIVAGEAQGGDNDVGDLVFLVKDLDGGCEGVEVGYGGVGEGSGVGLVRHLPVSLRKSKTYSASNWFGRIRSASLSSALYCGTSSSGM